MKITMGRIKELARQWGSYYFSKDTMRFFGTKLSNDIHTGPGGIFFVQSDRVPEARRRYKVRYVNIADEDIEIVGRFEGYTASSEAHDVAERLSLGEEVEL